MITVHAFWYANVNVCYIWLITSQSAHCIITQSALHFKMHIALHLKMCISKCTFHPKLQPHCITTQSVHLIWNVRSKLHLRVYVMQTDFTVCIISPIYIRSIIRICLECTFLKIVCILNKVWSLFMYLKMQMWLCIIFGWLHLIWSVM